MNSVTYKTLWFKNFLNNKSPGKEYFLIVDKKFDTKKKIAAQAVKFIQDQGVILRALPGDIIGICPPLIISENETNRLQ